MLIDVILCLLFLWFGRVVLTNSIIIPQRGVTYFVWGCVNLCEVNEKRNGNKRIDSNYDLPSSKPSRNRAMRRLRFSRSNAADWRRVLCMIWPSTTAPAREAYTTTTCYRCCCTAKLLLPSYDMQYVTHPHSRTPLPLRSAAPASMRNTAQHR